MGFNSAFKGLKLIYFNITFRGSHEIFIYIAPVHLRLYLLLLYIFIHLYIITECTALCIVKLHFKQSIWLCQLIQCHSSKVSSVQ